MRDSTARVVMRRSRSMPSSTSTVLASSLCGASAVADAAGAGFRGLLGPAATGSQRDTRHEDDERLDSHRSIAALASRSIRANAASRRASRY